MTSANAGQIEYWNGDVGRRWAALQERLDALFADVTAVALEAAALQAGESVLDIGCGCGGTTVALAKFVGPTGHVLGLDISEPMLAVARERLRIKTLDGVTLVLGDAATHAFAPGAAYHAFSRFGVMFFDDPAGAFRNIRAGLRPGGRLAFVCWRPYTDNPFFAVPYRAAKPLLGMPEEPKSDPHAPGPFAFADPDRVRALLAEAEFSSVAVEPADVSLPLAGTNDLAAAVDLVTKVGPVARALAAADPDRRPAAEAAVREALRAFDGPDGIVVPACIWVVTASVPVARASGECR